MGTSGSSGSSSGGSSSGKSGSTTKSDPVAKAVVDMNNKYGKNSVTLDSSTVSKELSSRGLTLDQRKQVIDILEDEKGWTYTTKTKQEDWRGGGTARRTSNK
jgi:hypothetical protein